MRVLLRQPSLAVPHIEVADIRHIDFRQLRAAGCKAVIFDKDNTLTAPYVDDIEPRLAEALRECREGGFDCAACRDALREAVRAMTDAGFTLRECDRAGFSKAEMGDAFVDAREWKVAGMTAADAKASEDSARDDAREKNKELLIIVIHFEIFCAFHSVSC